MANVKFTDLPVATAPGGTEIVALVQGGDSKQTTVADLSTGLTGLTVAQGGTGAATFTDHGVMLGSGTAALTPTAAMTNGQLLVGATGADPAPQTVGGAFTLAANGTATLAASVVGTANLANAVADALWTVTATDAAEAGDKIVVSVQVKDIQTNSVAAATVLVFKPVSAVDASYAVSDEGAGTGLTTSGDKVSAITTSAAGLAEIGITDTAAETIVLAFETPLGPVIKSLTFA